jgi:hypothetical protein
MHDSGLTPNPKSHLTVEPVQDMTSSHIHLLVKDNGPNARIAKSRRSAGRIHFGNKVKLMQAISAPTAAKPRKHYLLGRKC